MAKLIYAANISLDVYIEEDAAISSRQSPMTRRMRSGLTSSGRLAPTWKPK